MLKPRLLFPLLPLVLGACAAPQPIIPPPLDLPRNVAEHSAQAQDVAQRRELATGIGETPKPPSPERLQTGKPAPKPTPVGEEAADITLAFEQIPLPAFIQAVYATILKRNVNLDPNVMGRKDLVTLRTGNPQTSTQVENAVRLLLKSYGLTVVEMGSLVRVVPDNANLGYLPEIRRGRAQPETPLPLRPVFQLVELNAVRNPDVANWLRTLFGDKVIVQEDASRNAVLLSGIGDNIQAALEAIHVLDQPLMKGRQSLRVSPVYWSADELAKKLGEILTAEGYGISTTTGQGITYPVTLLPVSAVNAVFVFAGSQSILDHVTAWAKELDRPNEKGVGRSFFTYPVQYTDAQSLAVTLEKLLGGAAVISTDPAKKAALGRVVVDAGSNSLIFQGNSEDYGQIRGLLQSLDKPAKEALIEVTVAEVSLTDDSQFGIEWLLKEASISGAVTAATFGGLKVGSAGLTIKHVNSAGETRLLLNALASSNRATILSSPRVVARNGETASIQVGQEVPIVTSQQTNPTTGGTGGILQTVQYRSAGVILNVKPVIHSGDQVDLDISQEVSSVATQKGVADSPIFSSRKLQTKLSLRNGATVLLGGLISKDQSQGNTGIPLLKDIPLLGHAFRNDSESVKSTELIVLITPYIISDDNDAAAVTAAFRGQLGEWARQTPTPLSRPGQQGLGLKLDNLATP